MKKIYLLVFSLLIGNIAIVSATSPKNKSGSNGTRHYSATHNGNNQNPVSKSTKKNSFVNSPNSAVSGAKVAGGGCQFGDNFNGSNDLASLAARGYLTYFNGGGPPGTSPIWFQGKPTFFPSYNGPSDGYLASDYNTVTVTNDIDNWLVLPAINLNSGDAVSFFARTVLDSQYPDSIHVWYSAAGDSTPSAASWVLLGEFKADTTGDWEYKSFIIPTASANGRIAIRYAVIDGGPGGLNSYYIGIDELNVYTPSSVDANLASLMTPVSGCVLSNAEQVKIVVDNDGTLPIYGFAASYTIDAGTPVVELITDTIAPGGTYTYTFTAPADLSVAGSHSVDINVAATNDSNVCNDMKTITVDNFAPADPLTLPYKMGFEPTEDLTGWKVVDANGDGTTWETIDTLSHSGTDCLLKFGSGVDDDEWLFTNCLDLASGSTYTLDYWYKNFDLIAACQIETYLCSGQDVNLVGQSVNQAPIPNDTTYQHSITAFSPTSSGTYYLAFHAYSTLGTGTSAIFLDDINLDDGSFIGIAENKNPVNVKVFPNPATGVVYLNSSYAGKNVVVEVFNVGGQIVYSSNFTNLNQQRIDLTKQSNGVYTLKVTADSFVENHSIIIRH